MGGGAIQHAETMTFQDFLAASQGDERLAMARWLAHKINKTQTAEMWSIVPPDILEGMSPDVFSLADAVLVELARVRQELAATDAALKTTQHAFANFRKMHGYAE